MVTPNWKPSRTARKLKERQTKLDRKATERKSMNEVRKVDKTCRFPLCGCKKLGLAQHISHMQHRGIGGNPKGDRTQPENLIKLCFHRHQDGAVSIHRGTLKIEPLTDAGARGPVLFWVDTASLSMPAIGAYTGPWFLIASEIRPGVLEPLFPMQEHYLKELARMEK